MVAEIAERHKAYNLRILEVTSHCDFADYFLVMSAQSTRQARALVEAIAEEMGVSTSKAEGFQAGEWVLLDLGDVVVHVFHEPVRAYYNLDKLWGHVPAIQLNDLHIRREKEVGVRPTA